MPIPFRRVCVGALTAALLAAASPATLATLATAAPQGSGTGRVPGPAAHSLTLADGSVVHWSDDGTGTLTREDGNVQAFPVPQGKGRDGLGAPLAPTADLLQRRVDAAGLTPFKVGAGGAATSAVRPQTMNSGAVRLPDSVRESLAGPAARRGARTAGPAGGAAVPSNEGLATSFQSYLNAGGVDAVGAFQDAATYQHALPGQGQIITNVSLGDLTDQSMADAGDTYVRAYGPTTVVKDGQRYLDYPSLPLIPTYTSDDSGRLDPTGTTEGQDPNLAEVLLDFSMMAPLPHDRQRPGATGSGPTDLLGIAPGAQYRLVIPQEPSTAGIVAALRAAAAQKPRPDVITASLGFGTDGTIGFPARWLEDDPQVRDTLRSIVDSGIVVVVSSNDGTRLGLPVSVGPDGGSTPTDRTSSARSQTVIGDVAPTTTPSLVRDTGVISAGGTTVDDTLTSGDVRTAVYPTTRYNGAASYSSGFGSRVDLAALGDNLPSLYHVSDGTTVVLNGGTSASAPMIAAAAADVLSAADATGRTLSPRQVRDLLVATGRPIAPLAADASRSVPVTFEAVDGRTVVASAAQTLTFGPADGTYSQAQAPVAPGAVPLGRPVTVHYDLTGLRDATGPELLLSSVGHWTPYTTTDKWRAQWSTPLTAAKGSVTIPASAFAPGGAGLYGVGIAVGGGQVFGDFRAVRVGPDASQRPDAPLLTGSGGIQGHAVGATFAASRLRISWNAEGVDGADGAAVEFLTPAPTLYGALNTATNQNGSGRDDNGVDHASTLWRALPSVKGGTVLDLRALGLPTGLQYPVRIIATRAGKPVGQASPTSFLTSTAPPSPAPWRTSRSAAARH
jgi:hypothetical protein